MFAEYYSHTGKEYKPSDAYKKGYQPKNNHSSLNKEITMKVYEPKLSDKSNEESTSVNSTTKTAKVSTTNKTDNSQVTSKTISSQKENVSDNYVKTDIPKDRDVKGPRSRNNWKKDVYKPSGQKETVQVEYVKKSNTPTLNKLKLRSEDTTLFSEEIKLHKVEKDNHKNDGAKVDNKATFGTGSSKSAIKLTGSLEPIDEISAVRENNEHDEGNEYSNKKQNKQGNKYSKVEKNRAWNNNSKPYTKKPVNETKSESEIFAKLCDDKEPSVQLADLENEERPLWEDIDTKQVLVDIKQHDYLHNMNQNFKSAFPQNASITNNSEKLEKIRDSKDLLEKLILEDIGEESEKISKTEDSDEDYELDHNQVFALRILSRGFSRPNLEVDTKPLPTQSSFKNAYKKVEKSPLTMATKMNPLSGTPELMNMNYLSTQSAYLPSDNLQEKPCHLSPIIEKSPLQGKDIFGALAADYEEKLWYYIDKHDVVQGPYSSKVMDAWYAQGHLPENLQLAINEEGPFKSLKEFRQAVTTISLQEDCKVKNMDNVDLPDIYIPFPKSSYGLEFEVSTPCSSILADCENTERRSPNSSKNTPMSKRLAAFSHHEDPLDKPDPKYPPGKLQIGGIFLNSIPRGLEKEVQQEPANNDRVNNSFFVKNNTNVNKLYEPYINNKNSSNEQLTINTLQIQAKRVSSKGGLGTLGRLQQATSFDTINPFQDFAWRTVLADEGVDNNLASHKVLAK